MQQLRLEASAFRLNNTAEGHTFSSHKRRQLCNKRCPLHQMMAQFQGENNEWLESTRSTYADEQADL
jgi:hypothetical protein